jgi:hypothetical protein
LNELEGEGVAQENPALLAAMKERLMKERLYNDNSAMNVATARLWERAGMHERSQAVYRKAINQYDASGHYILAQNIAEEAGISYQRPDAPRSENGNGGQSV